MTRTKATRHQERKKRKPSRTRRARISDWGFASSPLAAWRYNAKPQAGHRKLPLCSNYWTLTAFLRGCKHPSIFFFSPLRAPSHNLNLGRISSGRGRQAFFTIARQGVQGGLVNFAPLARRFGIDPRKSLA